MAGVQSAGRWAAWCRAVAMAGPMLAVAATAQAQAGAYSFAAPPGWAVGGQNGFITMAAPDAPQDASAMIYPPVAAVADTAGQFANANAMLEQGVGVRNPIVDAPVKTVPADGGSAMVRGSHYATERGNVFIMSYARIERGVFAYAAYVGFAPEIFQKYLPAVTQTFASLRVTAEGARLAGVQGKAASPSTAAAAPAASGPAGGRDEPPAPAAAAQGQIAAAPAAIPAAPPLGAAGPALIQDLIGTWAGSATRDRYHHTINFDAPWAYGGFEQSTVGGLMMSAGAGGMVIRVRQDGWYSLHYDSVENGCRTVRDHDGTLTRPSADAGSTIRMDPVHYVERVEHADPRKPAAGCSPRQSTTAVPVSFRHFRNPFSIDGWLLTPELAVESTVPAEAGIIHLYRMQSAPLSAGQKLDAHYFTGMFDPNAADPLLPALEGEYRAEELVNHQGRQYPRYQATLRLSAGGRYEFAAKLVNVFRIPLCFKTLTLVEQGEVRMGRHLRRNAPQWSVIRMQPAASRLTETIVNCGPDDGSHEVELPKATRFFWLEAGKGLDPLPMSCPEAGYRGPMQELFCPTVVSTRIQSGLTRSR